MSTTLPVSYGESFIDLYIFLDEEWGPLSGHRRGIGLLNDRYDTGIHIYIYLLRCRPE